jgi:hypothetical protein
MVVVGPGVVQVDVCTALLLGAGVGFGREVGVARGVELPVLAARIVAAAVGVVVGRFFGVTDDDGVGVAEVVAGEVASGGDCDPCTRTLPDPPLHAVTASKKQNEAVAIPLLPMPA